MSARAGFWLGMLCAAIICGAVAWVLEFPNSVFDPLPALTKFAVVFVGAIAFLSAIAILLFVGMIKE